jgi:hypothetical protein
LQLGEEFVDELFFDAIQNFAESLQALRSIGDE